MAQAELDEVVPWEFRVARVLPISALATGVVIALVLIAAFLGFHWVLGFPIFAAGEGLTDGARRSISAALLVGYTFGALNLGATGIERDLGRAGAEERADVAMFPRDLVRRSRYAGAIGLVFGILVVTAVARAQGYAMTAPWTALHELSFLIWLLVLIFWLIARAAVFTIRGSRFAAGVTVEEIEIDLLDLEPLNAFGRIGLRFALLWIVGVTLAAPLLLGPDLELTALLGALGIVGGIAAVAFLIPVLGVHRLIRDTKRAELAHIVAAIAGDDSAGARTRIAKREHDPSLADWIAYRGLIESAREWPYDASTLSRFVLYLLIPLASWVAAVFVERALDAMLG